MVGLSIVLETQKSILISSSSSNTKTTNSENYNHNTTNNIINPQLINKTTMIINKPSSSSFLDQCFLCNQKLLPTKDIYMYKGDRAFCSVECRYRQIFMDEEEGFLKDNCSMAATKPSSSSSSSSRHRKGTRNRAL